MKRIIQVICLLLVTSLSTGLSARSSTGGAVLRSKGTVLLNNLAVKNNDEIATGDVLKCDKDAWVDIEFRDGDRIRVGGGNFTLEWLKFKSAFSEKKIVFDKGKMYFISKARDVKKSFFQIKTPVAIGEIRGSRAEGCVETGSDESKLALVEGIARFESRNKMQALMSESNLTAGQQQVVLYNKRSPVPAPLKPETLKTVQNVLRELVKK